MGISLNLEDCVKEGENKRKLRSLEDWERRNDDYSDAGKALNPIGMRGSDGYVCIVCILSSPLPAVILSLFF